MFLDEGVDIQRFDILKYPAIDKNKLLTPTKLVSKSKSIKYPKNNPIHIQLQTRII